MLTFGQKSRLVVAYFQRFKQHIMHEKTKRHQKLSISQNGCKYFANLMPLCTSINCILIKYPQN